MATVRRSSRRAHNAIWPGFVDAMTGLLLVLMFVLTIFMVIQFVLRETITGQASELDQLTAEVTALNEALGFEETRTTMLNAEVDTMTAQATSQAGLIARLSAEKNATSAALIATQNQITSFEAQVAGLQAQQSQSEAAFAALEVQQTRLISETEALNLALASARNEIDASSETARLAAARREALEALIADLETTGQSDAGRISDLESQKLVDAAAAQALRDGLANADTELTAMTLSLEQKRREAEDTLTLLAAAQAAREGLDVNLATALLAQQQAQQGLSNALAANQDLDARLLAALSLQEITETDLAATRATLDAANSEKMDLTTRLASALSSGGQTEDELAQAKALLDAALAENAATKEDVQERLAAAVLAQESLRAELAASGLSRAETEAARRTLEERLAEALIARQSLEAENTSLSAGQSDTAKERASLEARLSEALAAIATAQEATATQLTERERQAILLAQANSTLNDEKALSAESRRQVAALNAQVADLRTQLGTLQALLNLAEESDLTANVQIEQLGSKLNAALAQVAAEERRNRALEEAEVARLQAEALNLERFRSDFFGQMRQVLEGQDRVQIVGDRFVFSSEVLFQPGQATLSSLGQEEIAKIASILLGLVGDIPENIDWVIRVDGHTDNVPLTGTGEFRNNWELSQARALSVVEYMVNVEGFPPNRLAANGFGEFRPIETADTEIARAQNRRIELKLTER